MQQLLDYEERLYGQKTIDFEDYCKTSLQAQLRNIRAMYAEKENISSQSEVVVVEESVS
jgi:hypothetical protein